MLVRWVALCAVSLAAVSAINLAMATQCFYLAGADATQAQEIDISDVEDLDGLKALIAEAYHVIVPAGVGFQAAQTRLNDLNQIKDSSEVVMVTVDDHAIRDPPGPPGVPFVGNYLEIFPDHLGNNQRLFDRYGPIFQTTSFGKTTFQVNDPDLALLVFTEGEFFSKQIVENHPLFPMRDAQAGVFLSDTNTDAWRIVHKFMPPALGPKAVRHYSPIMNHCIDNALHIFDQLEAIGDTWNVYQYMVKLASETVAKVVLGMDFDHFKEVDTPFHPMVAVLADVLSINKKIASKGSLYSSVPIIGDSQKLHGLQAWQKEQIEKVILHHESSGTQDLELQDAALEAANMIDYLCRAVDTSGQKLPKDNLISACLVASGAGFSTTATLLSWLVYGLVTYPGMQERLLQELVNMGYSDGMAVTPELIEKLSFQEKYVKEMQRIHNPSYQPGRTVQEDCILPGGYKLSKGDVVIAAIHHIHNNEKHWDNPKLFDPDRWDTEKVKNRHKASYCPFALGHRSCIGFNFALQEVKTFLPKLVWRYQWFKEGETAVQYDPFFQLVRPVNLYVRTKKRTVWPSSTDMSEWVSK